MLVCWAACLGLFRHILINFDGSIVAIHTGILVCWVPVGSAEYADMWCVFNYIAGHDRGPRSLSVLLTMQSDHDVIRTT